MNQITDSLAPSAGDRARAGGRPRQGDGKATDTLSDATGKPDAAPEGARPARGRKPAGPAQAFADVMQVDAAATAQPVPAQEVPPAPRTTAALARSGDVPQMAQRSPSAPAQPDARSAVIEAVAPEGPAASPPAGAERAPAPAARAATAAQPQAVDAPAARGTGARPGSRAQPEREPPVASAASGRAEDARAAAAARPAEPTLPVAVDRPGSAVSCVLTILRPQQSPLLSAAAPSPEAGKAAARAFAEQMTGSTARLASGSPMQKVAVPRPAPPVAAAVADVVTPSPESLVEPAPDTQPGISGGERQGLLITSPRLAPAAAAPLLHHMQPATPASASESILAQISTHLSSNGRSEMTLQLDPPELGLVRIGLSMGEGQVTAVITADRSDVDSMLRRHVGQLATALEEAGYKGVDLSFGGGGQGMGDDGSDPPPAPSAVVRLAAADTSARIEAGGVPLPGDGLDLRL